MTDEKPLKSRSLGELSRRSLVTRIAGLGTGLALASTNLIAAREMSIAAASTHSTSPNERYGMRTQSSSDDIVSTSAGQVRGVETNNVSSFKGIPFAASPLGDLRWRAPQPVETWTGVLDATDFCTDCIQALGLEDIQTTPSEDCLCLNVWRPAGTSADAALPVLVWVHGGGYVGGGSSIPIYDGSAFASQGMIVVTFNYRVGRLGFFAHPALIEAGEGYVGNYGLLDQIQALEWVQENIAAFGGDPGRVTIAGESAGGASVIHLMTSPIVGDLFHQAVVMSGGGRNALIVRPMAEDELLGFSAPTVDAAFALENGIRGRDAEALEALRQLDPEILAGREDLEQLAKVILLGGSLTGVPVIDDAVIVGQPQDHFLSGTSKQIPILIGSTAIDVPTVFPPSKISPLRWFGDDEDAAREAYGFGDDRFLGPQDLITLLLSIGADMTMHEAAHFVASTMKNAGQPSWVYRFTYTAESTRPEQVAQAHSGELPFMFDTLEARYGDAVTANDQAMASAFHTYIGNFVRTGDPNGAALPEWPEVVPSEFNLMNFTLDDGPVYGADPRPGVPLVARAWERQIAEQES